MDGTEPSPRASVPAAEAARHRLEALELAPVDDHVEIFDDVQRILHDGLTDLDDA